LLIADFCATSASHHADICTTASSDFLGRQQHAVEHGCVITLIHTKNNTGITVQSPAGGRALVFVVGHTCQKCLCDCYYRQPLFGFENVEGPPTPHGHSHVVCVDDASVVVVVMMMMWMEPM
jgi:hypothetical protein